MWKGGECWVIGGGPSVPRLFGVPDEIVKAVHRKELGIDAYSPYLSAIHDKHIIGVNTAYMLGDWVDVVTFGDIQFYLEHAQRLLNFRNIKVSIHERACSGQPGCHHIKYVPQDTQQPTGLTDRKYFVSWNKHSGAGAINLALHFGCKRVYLLGFDMKLDMNGKSHSHAEYFRDGFPKYGKNLPYAKHLSMYPHIARDAKRHGMEILNVNDDSAIQDLPMVSLEDVL